MQPRIAKAILKEQSVKTSLTPNAVTSFACSSRPWFGLHSTIPLAFVLKSTAAPDYGARVLVIATLTGCFSSVSASSDIAKMDIDAELFGEIIFSSGKVLRAYLSVKDVPSGASMVNKRITPKTTRISVSPIFTLSVIASTTVILWLVALQSFGLHSDFMAESHSSLRTAYRLGFGSALVYNTQFIGVFFLTKDPLWQWPYSCGQ